MTRIIIAIVLLQIVGTNLGAHQLHSGNDYEESNNHPHLQFTAEVLSLEACFDCSCALDGARKHALTDDHQHKASQSETQQIDVCLDCQCHGGHAAIVMLDNPLLLKRLHTDYSDFSLGYFPPETFPSYRPPIA